MKKLVTMVLAGILVLSNCISVFATENDSPFYITLNSNEIEENDVQKVFLHIDDQELLSQIDLVNSFLVISDGINERKIKTIISEDNTYYFQFVIDDTFGVGSKWVIKEVNLISLQNVSLEVDFSLGDSFAIKSEEGITSNEIFNITASSNEEPQVLVTSSPLPINVTTIDGNGSYTISGTVSESIKKILIASWSEKGGQDDLVWEEVPIVNGEINHVINIRNHNYETGKYISHIYTYDENDNPFVHGLTAMVRSEAPTLTDIQITQGDGAYTITATISGNTSEVLFPTWTNKNGQDDILWHIGSIVGNKVSCTISMNDHNNETGLYTMHAYLYDANGNPRVYEFSQNMIKENPKVSDLKIVNGDGFYTVTGKVNSKTTKVLFPTWTSKNGQDDIAWEEGLIQGDIVTHTVYMKNHNNEIGEYNTHVYAYDAQGDYTVEALKANINKVSPEVKNIIVTGGDGQYTITANITGNVTKVLFPTWTSKNGQDDIVWEEGVIKGDKVTHTIYIRDHNFETDKYITHLYAYDANDNYTAKAIEHSVSIGDININDINTTKKSGVYTLTVDISGAVSKVLFPTWTERNGQDDIVWHEGKINGNKAIITIDMKDHNFETGKYNTHVYAYDSFGNSVAKALSVNVENNNPVISDVKVSDVSSQGYLVTCTVTDDYKLDRVLFPTWTTSNGQDDIVWSEGTINGNEVTYRVYVKDHKYAFGEYNTHIYAYDAAGNLTAQSIAPVSINESNLSSGWKVVNGNKYLYDASGKLVDGSGLFVIDISEHNGNVDWQAVKNAGVDGVILRSSYGYDFDHGFSESQMDAKFKRNVSELNRLGIPYGIYHFSYARSIGEGKQEANYMIECMKAAGARPTLPVYYDLESSPYVGYKDGNFYTTITKEFSEVINNAGYKFGVYANYNWFSTKLTDTSFNNYIKWVAHYGTDANNSAGTANPNWHPSSEYKMWQYSSKGKVNGINGNVDLNVLLNW